MLSDGSATRCIRAGFPDIGVFVLRALIADGLKRDDHPTLLANVESQAKAVRRLRSVARQGGRAEREPGE